MHVISEKLLLTVSTYLPNISTNIFIVRYRRIPVARHLILKSMNSINVGIVGTYINTKFLSAIFFIQYIYDYNVYFFYYILFYSIIVIICNLTAHCNTESQNGRHRIELRVGTAMQPGVGWWNSIPGPQLRCKRSYRGRSWWVHILKMLFSAFWRNIQRT